MLYFSFAEALVLLHVLFIIRIIFHEISIHKSLNRVHPAVHDRRRERRLVQYRLAGLPQNTI